MALLLFPAVLLVTLQLPPVQNFIVNYISYTVSKKTGFQLTIEDVSIRWLDAGEFQQIKLLDPDSNMMLDANSLYVDLNIWNILTGDIIEEDNIEFDTTTIYLAPIIVEDTNRVLNLSLFIQRLRNYDPDNPTPTPEGKLIHLHRVAVNHGKVVFNDWQKDRLESGLDLNHFTISDLHTEWKELKIDKGVITANIELLSGIESNTELAIENLSSGFYYDSTTIDFHGLNAQFGKSLIRDTLEIHYRDKANFRNFRDSVELHLNFDKSILYQEDIARIMPPGNYLPYKMELSGKFNGTISNFKLEDYTLAFGRSRLEGTAGFTGLPDISETFLNLRFKNSRINPEDLQNIISVRNQLLSELGNLQLNGRFIGYVNDFVAFAEIDTQNGKINSDLNLKIPETGEPTYAGRLQLRDFRMGEYLDNEDIGRINFTGSVLGTSFNPEKIRMDLNGDFNLLEFKDYPYQRIYVDGQIANNFYQGYLRINDPNLQFELDGTVDLRKKAEKISMISILNHISLKPLGLSESDIIARTTAELDFRGLSIDEIVGEMKFKDSEIQVDDRYMKVDSASLYSEFRDDSTKVMKVRSDLADVDIEGKYQLVTVYKNLRDLVKKYNRIILDPGLEDDSIRLEQTEKPSYLSYKVKIHEIDPLLSLLKEDVQLSEIKELKGEFAAGKTTSFNLFTEIDSLRYGKYEFNDNLVELNISSGPDTLSTAGSLVIQSKKQNLAGINLEDISLNLNLEKLNLDFDLNARQEQYNNFLSLNGDVKFGSVSTIVTLENSSLDLLGRPWQIDRLARLEFSDSKVGISNVIISNEFQGLFVEGNISSDSTDRLTIQFESLGLQNINSLINKDLYGFLSGYMNISNVYGNTKIENDLSILEMSINNYPVGDVFGKVLWDKDNKEFDLDFTVEYNKVLTMDLNGYYRPKDTEEPLYLDAKLLNAPVNLLEPWIGKYFSNLTGTATGEFQIKGSTFSPRVFGRGKLLGGSFRVNYLMVDYFLEGDFSFSENIIFMDNITVSDRFQNSGRLLGSIDHGGFKNMSVDLLGRFNGIQVLNTSAADNSLFYGQGFGTGDISFKGPVNNLSITANARTEKGTRIFIPIGGIDDVDTQDFINFTSFADTVKMVRPEVDEIDLKGVTLDLNIDVTNDAYAEIIFDIKAGDIIRGRGNGDLNLRIDTNGEFNMFGPLNIDEGWYNFTLYNLINKEFTIYPGGKITWYGDPYEGVMDLTASYRQPASIAPILDPTYAENPDVKRLYPTEVVMGLTGPLLSPEINFDIKAEQLPRNVSGTSLDMSLEFESFKNRIDEQELKRQVFSLIVLKKFSPPQEFNTGGVISNSVSELFSNQLSYWMSQVDENLEIDFDVDLTTFDQEAFNTFQMRLSYTFFDGRLRLTRDGTFINQEDEVDLNSLAGNWSVEYLITQDGRVKARVYNRNNYDNLNLSERNNNTTGISLQYTQSFNEFFKELGKVFKSNKKSNEKDPSQVPPQEPPALLNEENEDNLRKGKMNKF